MCLKSLTQIAVPNLVGGMWFHCFRQRKGEHVLPEMTNKDVE